MPKRTAWRISVCLSAIVLLGALAMRASFAEEGGSSAQDGKTSGGSAEGGSSQPASGEDATAGAANEGTSKGTNAPAINANTPVPDAKNLEGVDTRITVQSRRLGPGPGKAVSPAARIFQRPTLSTPRASNRTVRNAIGLPIVQHENTERRDGEQPYSRSVLPNPAAGTMGVARSTTGDLATFEGSLGRPIVPAPNARPVVRSVVVNRGTINGTGLTRPGVGPSGIGGPKKPVTGISGTTIRPAH